MSMLNTTAIYCKTKVDNWFRRIFKEQAGGAELVATLVIVGIVLVLAFAFKDKITTLVGDLWNALVRGESPDKSQTQIVSEW